IELSQSLLNLISQYPNNVRI
ncbi:VanZ family protein, partial [Listeria monocytogenes]|nr:VanZ family protein [Listeria monocytogenes]EAH3837982.1 VanZ family protein [Listeria monocytogenes]